MLPPILRLTITTLSATGIYLLDEGVALFGRVSFEGVDVSLMELPKLETNLSMRLWNVISELRADRLYYCPLEIVRSVDPDFIRLKWRLIEDRDVFQGANYSYAEYVQLLTGGNPGY